MGTSPWPRLREELSLPAVPDELLQQAFQHGSYVREQGLDHALSNQRLEFLGDAVLDLIVAEELYRRNAHLPEGQLTKRKAAAVRASSLARIAAKMGLGEYLLLGRGEEESGGRSKPSLLADALEALVGAVYLASGLAATRQFLLPYFVTEAQVGAGADFDHKTALQELVQAYTKQVPTYHVISTEGPAHRLAFTVEVRFAGKRIGRGSGGSKRQAAQAAAHEALKTSEQWLAELAGEGV